jgi:membrane protease YdiL (CAAX protease family)
MAKLETQFFVDALRAHPVLTVLAVGLLAGLCEELLFRGPVQASMLRKLPPWAAIGFAAIIFAAAHLDLHGFVIRALLGVLLGWMVWRSRSIFPAMVAHALFDSTQLALTAWQLRHQGDVTVDPSKLVITTSDVVALGVGALLLVAGTVVWRLRSDHPAAEAFPSRGPSGAPRNEPASLPVQASSVGNAPE